MVRVTALVLLVAVPALLGAGASEQPAEPRLTAVRLPGSVPQRLALTDDGSLWMTPGITRLDPAGRRRRFRVDAVDLVKGPDGAMWFAGPETVGRIDRAGRVRTWRDAYGDAITVANGAVWVTSDFPPGIERLNPNGTTARHHIAGPRPPLWMPGIAPGPDGALWFTQAGSGRDSADGIGRMTTEGRYASWALPRRRAGPTRIAAGPDGALWFTERDAHAIGRITTGGAITEFPLRTGLSPDDITAGADGALWFTADGCIGRITPSGDVTAWLVTSTGRLRGIAAAPNGGFWVADDLGSKVWRFTPPADARPPAVACAPPAVTRSSGSTRATVVYRREHRFGHEDFFADARIRIERGGRPLFAEAVPRHPRDRVGYRVLGSSTKVAVRDLDRDGEPEAMLELHWGGTHCCHWSRTYRYDPARSAYVPVNHFWGNAPSAPSLKDLDRDGRPEFVSQDDRLTEAFAGYANSWRPIQIWSYDRGRFRDVTRRHPRQIRRDAARLWHYFVKYRAEKGGREILPAWAADQYMLGRGERVSRALALARRRGYLTCTARDNCSGPRKAALYIRALKRLLRKTGYIGD